MSLVFSAIVPHSPLLIPAIGQDNLERLADTNRAYEKLARDLELSQADTIIIISPHGPIHDSVFIINLHPDFKSDFQEFGDLSTTVGWKGNIGMAHRLKEKLETSANLIFTSETKLDYGSAVPLYLLTLNLPQIKIIPLYYSGLDLKTHFNFGQHLNREIIYQPDRVAVIASGDLSHRLSKNAPGGYSPKAKKFDKKIIDYLQTDRIKEVLSLEAAEIAAAGECGLKSIVILLGILEGMKYQPELYSYEAPFGVGYMVMNLKL